MPGLNAFAIEEGGVSERKIAFEKLDVKIEVEQMGFSEENLPEVKEGEVALLSFQEYGYSEDFSITADYGLYLYIYNPWGMGFDFDSFKNMVQIGNCFDDNGACVDYDKYQLELVSRADNDKFVKLKVCDELVIDIHNELKSSERKYNISGIELLETGYLNATEYSVATIFYFTGYAKGYAEDKEAESTLSCRTVALDTIELEVKHTTYKVYNTDNRTGQELATVYFNVPEKYFNEYGALQKIKAEWLYSVSDYIYCTLYKNLHDEIFFNLGKSGSDISGLRYFLYSKFENNASTRTGTYYDAYNFKDSMVTGYSYNVASTIDQINWVMYKDVASYDELRIPSEELLTFYKENKDVYNLLSYQDESKTTKVIDAGDKYDLKGLAADHSYWTWLWEKLGFTHTVEEVAPIYTVKVSDLLLSKEDFANTLKVNINDVDDIKAMASKIGSRTVLFRFALNNFEDQKLLVGLNKNEQNYADFPGNSEKIIYRTKLPLYQDFDIIWLGFQKEGKLTIIPAVSNPITVMGGTEPPLFNEDKDHSLGALLESLIPLISKGSGCNGSSCAEFKQTFLTVVAVLIGVLFILLVIKVIAFFVPKRKYNRSSTKVSAKRSSKSKKSKSIKAPRV